MSLGKKIIAGFAALLLLGAVLLGVGLFAVAPSVAQKMVQERLDRVESRLGLTVTTDSIDTVGLGGVELRNLKIVDPKTGRTLVTVGTAGGKVSVPRLLTGDRVITDVWSHDVLVVATREEDGQFDLVRALRGGGGDDAAADDAAKDPTSEPATSGLLRQFGGTLPAVDITNVQLKFEAVDGVARFPVHELTIPMLEIAHDDGIAVSTKIAVVSDQGGDWTLPSEVSVAAQLTDELKAQSLNVTFDRTVEVAGLEPFPFLRAGFDGVELSPEGLVMITDAHLGFRSEEEPFAKTGQIAVSVAQWALNPKNIVLGNLTIESPQMTLSYDSFGASQLSDLDHALRAPRARDVAATAAAVASAIDARRSTKTDEPVDLEAEEAAQDAQQQQQQAAAAKGPSRIERLITKLPQEIIVKNATIDATDHRTLPVARRAQRLRLENGSLRIAHSLLESTLTLQGAFDALGDGQPRGSANGVLAVNYRTKQVDADVEVDALDLSWLGQILGARVADKIRGGTLRAKLDVKQATGKAVTIEGNTSVEDLVFYWDLLAEEPLTDFTASYGFAATYDPDGTMPEPRLLKKGLFKESNTPADNDPIHRGSLVFTKGAAQVGDATASVIPAVYGTGALPGRMPKRVDLVVEVPKTPLQTIFDAVPVAIQGPVAGTKLAGDFSWKLDVEVPPYRAGDMEWVSEPLLENFELISIPSAVDPRNLMTGYRLTIETTLKNKKGEEYEWSRTIRIPPAKPVSAQYLIDNAGLELEVLDARRRKRDWPPIPSADSSWLPRTILESPQYWLSQSAIAQLAPKPWSDGDTIERTHDQPYGPYVFVPLHHISKWVVRTVTTTEDGGFFRHPGFLFDSLKESVEDNIEANRFRRGGSTISMQLVKNAFLDQKKLLARKIREAFLVWLMESEVNVPKSRILEVYLNIIEFGPGIYGIHDASVHYFGKRPDELNVAEVAWLFSILPSPKRYHAFYDKGEISASWFAKMKRYLDAMVRRDKLTAEERDQVDDVPPAFYKPNIELGEPVLRPTAPVVPDLLGIPFFGGTEQDPQQQQQQPPQVPQQVPQQQQQRIPSPNQRPDDAPPKKKKGGLFRRNR